MVAFALAVALVFAGFTAARVERQQEALARVEAR